MNNIKTITLNGTEQSVNIAGNNCDIRNDGTDVIYACAHGSITAGADGVVSIPAGGAVKLATNGTVFLLGTGTALLVGNDYQASVFKCAAAMGGSSEDAIARNAISTHAANDVIHFSGEKVSGCNLLLNPDFRINQRGVSGNITAAGYFVDRWRLASGSVNVAADGTVTLNGTIEQQLEFPPDEAVCVSAGAGSASYDSATGIFSLTAQGEALSWAKLEYGSFPTRFTPPKPDEELLKCCRYGFKWDSFSRYPRSYRTSARVNSFVIPTPVPLRTLPEVEGLLFYSADVLSSDTLIENQTYRFTGDTSGSTLCLRATTEQEYAAMTAAPPDTGVFVDAELY